NPTFSGNILLVYGRLSHSGKWDNGATWNREHVWPKFWLNLSPSENGGKTIVTNTYKGLGSDAFELRPATVSDNRKRQDLGYGYYPNVGSGANTRYGPTSDGAGTTYWYPGDSDAGEVARIIFYMATRWFDPNDNTRGDSAANLDLKNGAPALYNFGDKASL